jgi:hypothetical protein
VARLRLHWSATRSQRVIEPGGHVSLLHATRLFVPVSLGPGAGKLDDGVIDTGAYLTVIPQSRWDVPGIRENISWLESAEQGPLSSSWTTIRGLSSLGVPARLGLILMSAVDETADVRLTSSVIALMAEDEHLPESQRIRTTLIGLHFGLLDRRRLVVEPDSQTIASAQAYLEDI